MNFFYHTTITLLSNILFFHFNVKFFLIYRNNRNNGDSNGASGGSPFSKIRASIRQQWRRGQDYRQLFEKEDLNRNGTISSTAFKQAILDLGCHLSSNEMNQVVSRFSR